MAGRLVCSGETIQKSDWREARPRMGLWRWRGLQAGPAPDPAPPGVLQSTAQRGVLMWAVEKGGAFTEEDGGKWGLWRKWGGGPQEQEPRGGGLFLFPSFLPSLSIYILSFLPSLSSSFFLLCCPLSLSFTSLLLPSFLQTLSSPFSCHCLLSELKHSPKPAKLKRKIYC